jgi:hypothetical protein
VLPRAVGFRTTGTGLGIRNGTSKQMVPGTVARPVETTVESQLSTAVSEGDF